MGFFVCGLMVRFCKELDLKKILLIVLSLFLIVGCSKNGKYTEYYDNGQKEKEGTWIDGELDGLHTEWYENRQKKMEGTWIDRKLDGLWTLWHVNGQKYSEATYKAGELDGLLTKWDNNGQKYLEETYKENELISQKCWDEDGNEIQCP